MNTLINMDHCESLTDMLPLAMSEVWKSSALCIDVEYQGVVMTVRRTSCVYDLIEKYHLIQFNKRLLQVAYPDKN